MRWSPLLVVPGLLALLGSGCAAERGEAYDAAFAAAQREFHAARWKEAAAAMEVAATQAHRVRDRDEARFLEARAFERAGMLAEARAIYVTLSESKDGSRDGPRRGRARFELATFEIEHGDAARGWTMLDEAARDFPKHGLARVAIHRLVMHAQEQGGEPAVLAFLDARTPTFKGTDQEAAVAFERAESLRRSGRKKEAHDAFLATAHAHAPYEGSSGGFADDSFWQAAAIDEEEGRFDEAIAHLREILTWRDASGYWSSYERPNYARAAFHIAEIYRDGLRDRRAARKAFHDVADLHPGTLKRDDAVWAEAKLAREDQDRAAVCALAKRIAEDFAESRYAPCAHTLCESVATPPKVKRACPGYLLRDLGLRSSAEPSEPSEPPEPSETPAPPERAQ